VTSVVRADPRTGRLVRRIVMAKVHVARDPGAIVPAFVRQAASIYGLDPLLVHAMIEVESDYQPYALSPRGAEGLMQLIPATARRFGVRNSFNFSENLLGGARYLRYLMDRFRDARLALAAYNAGEAAVVRYGGVPPYAETRNYIDQVFRRYRTAQRALSVTENRLPEDPEAPRPVQWFEDERGVLYLRTP
jgi:soluble lytic murein transglycosylase-like protein